MTTYDDNFKTQISSATPHQDFDDVTLRNMTADQVVAAIVAGRSTPDLGLVLAGITAEVQKRLDDAAAVLKPKGDKRVREVAP